MEIAAKSQSGTLSGWGGCVRASPARASGAKGTGTVSRCLVQRVCECVCVCACCSAAPYDASSHVIITRELEHAQGFRKQTWPPNSRIAGRQSNRVKRNEVGGRVMLLHTPRRSQPQRRRLARQQRRKQAVKRASAARISEMPQKPAIDLQSKHWPAPATPDWRPAWHLPPTMSHSPSPHGPDERGGHSGG